MAQHSLPTCIVLQEEAAAACIQLENVAEEEQEEVEQLEQHCSGYHQTLPKISTSGDYSFAYLSHLVHLHPGSNDALWNAASSYRWTNCTWSYLHHVCSVSVNSTQICHIIG